MRLTSPTPAIGTVDMSDIIQRVQYLYRRLYGVAGARKVRDVQQIFLYCHQSAPGPILSV